MAALASSQSPSQLSNAVLKPWHRNSSPSCGLLLRANAYPNKQNSKSFHRRSMRVMAATEGSANKSKEENGEDPSVPSWARPDSEELPPWARQEAQTDSSTFEVPFYVYLLASAITAIAAVPFYVYLLASAITAIAAIGSVFEYLNQKPVFGVLNTDSVFYAPLLGFFAFTGVPTSAFLWFKSVEIANKEAEDQDRKDGYL